jgi:hypothetical protein
VRDTLVRHRRRGHQESAAPGLPPAAAAPRTASVRLTPSRAENAPRSAAGAWRDIGRVGDPSISSQGNDLLEVDVNMELLAKSLGVMQPWETLAASPPPGRRSRQHGPAVGNKRHTATGKQSQVLIAAVNRHMSATPASGNQPQIKADRGIKKAAKIDCDAKIDTVAKRASLIRSRLPEAGVAGMWRFTAAIST